MTTKKWLILGGSLAFVFVVWFAVVRITRNYGDSIANSKMAVSVRTGSFSQSINGGDKGFTLSVPKGTTETVDTSVPGKNKYLYSGVDWNMSITIGGGTGYYNNCSVDVALKDQHILMCQLYSENGTPGGVTTSDWYVSGKLPDGRSMMIESHMKFADSSAPQTVRDVLSTLKFINPVVFDK